MRVPLFLPAFLLALAGVTLAPAGAAVADDTYVPTVPTSCSISVPSAVVGDRVVIRVRVSASTTEPVTGTIHVAVDRVAARARVERAAPEWTTSVRYDDRPVRIEGPRLSRGNHVASVRFVPDSATLTGCRDRVRFRVGADSDVGGEDDGAGGLPNTGGPHLSLLVLGLGLVGSGAIMVERSRQRRVTPGAA